MLTEPELVVSDGSDDWWLPTAELSPGLTPGYCMTLSCPMIGRLNLKIFTVLGSNLSFLVKYIEVLLAYFFINTNFYRWIWFDLCLTQENHHKIFNVDTTVDFIKKDIEVSQPILWVWKANQMLRCKGQVFHVMRGSMKYSKEGIELLRYLPFTFSLWAQNCVIL